MSPEEFRQWGHRTVDWVADYLGNPAAYPVLSRAVPNSVRSQLPDRPPLAGEPMEAVFRDLDKIVVPGLTHWNHPDFFAYFSSTASGPGILGELLIAAFNVNAMLWKTSPAATELEQVVLDWLRQMLGLSKDFTGVVYDTASVSTFHALAAARGSVAGWDVREDGLSGPGAPRLRLYASEQAHSSVEKAAIALGLGRVGLSKIPVDERYRMDPSRLEDAIRKDRDAGWRPFAVVATIGTTSTTSVDPVERIAEICRRHELWLHVDAAYAGAAAMLPERTDVRAGCDLADSLVMNPHKWMFTPADFSALYCRRPKALREAFSLVPAYLTTAEGDSVTNFMDYGIQLGRRFRSLKLWMVIRYFGVDGLRSILREHIRLAGLFAGWVESDAAFELAAPVPFSTVCFRLEGGDAANADLLGRVNASGRAFLSHTELDGRYTLRFTVGNVRTKEENVRRAWELISSLARGPGQGMNDLGQVRRGQV
jgi:aromatic-L-amino-acid decarboxylase